MRETIKRALDSDRYDWGWTLMNCVALFSTGVLTLLGFSQVSGAAIFVLAAGSVMVGVTVLISRVTIRNGLKQKHEAEIESLRRGHASDLKEKDDRLTVLAEKSTNAALAYTRVFKAIGLLEPNLGDQYRLALNHLRSAESWLQKGIEIPNYDDGVVRQRVPESPMSSTNDSH